MLSASLDFHARPAPRYATGRDAATGQRKKGADMVQYSGLRFWKDVGARDRAIDRLLALRAGLVKDVTPNNKQDSFHLATWNIRDFGGHRLNPSPRLPESLLYIAEVISSFDLVAVQEVTKT